ncbi:MAG: hypothetical protein ACOQNV_01470 [Mycoplasmoidaceae bacterium]
MRKFSLLKKISMGLGSVAAATPLVFSATSCSSDNAILANYISYDAFLNDESLEHMNNGHFDNDDLLLGSKKFFKGNYILLIGSNAYPTDEKGEVSATQKFFGSTESRIVDEWFANIHNSVWYRDVQEAGTLKLNRDFGFVTYIDSFNFRFFDGNNHEYYVTDNAKLGYGYAKKNIGPFDKWNKDWISQTRELNHTETYQWDKDEKVTESDYIRQDKSAKAFRAFMNRGASMFPTTDKRTKPFDTSPGNKASLLAIYKDGKLVDIVDMPTQEIKNPDPEKDKDTTTLYGTINKYFTDEEKED